MAPSRTSPERHTEEPQNGSRSKDTESTLWTVQDIPGKGKGLIVTQDIAPGTLLLSEAPILTTDVVTSFDMDITENDLENALKKLSLDSQKSFRNLHNNFHDDAKHPLSGIVKSNAYPLGADAEVGGVFPEISRINHSCRPNAVQYWNPLLEKQTIYAVRAISEGEEIAVSYHYGGPSETRKKILKDHFGFDCTCDICSLPAEELNISDERALETEELDDFIGSARNVHSNPSEVMKNARKLFKIYEEEKFKDGRLSRLYYDLFQMCNMHSDLARARCFAKYYCDTKKMAEGADSINVLEMKPYVKAPQKHTSFGSTDRWKTDVGDVPKGLKAIEFAKWLWREEA